MAAAVASGAIPTGGDLEPDALFAAAGARFEAAAQAVGGAIDRDYVIGGRTLRVRYAGPAMLHRFGPALEHLRGGEEPTHTVGVWDGSSTGSEAPPVPVPAGSPPGTIVTRFGTRRRLLYMVGLRSLSLYDADAARSWYWTAGADDLPSWECASPIRHILHWWLASRGIQQLHAGAVGTAKGGVLLVGGPGRGKSTTTLAALEAGLRYVGDDYVAVQLDPAPVVYSLFNAGKVEPDHLQRFPHLREIATIEEPRPADLEEPKALVYAHAHFSGQTVPSLPLRAVLIPSVSPGDPTSIAPVGRGEALRALGPSTMLQLHRRDQSLLSDLGRLVARIPAFSITLGDDLEAIGRLISSLLDDLPGDDG